MPKKVKRSPRLSCKEKLSEKIRINMREYRNGRWVSPQQAIAVSYSQVLKKSPSCKKVLGSKSRVTKRARKSRVTKRARKSPVKKSARKSPVKKSARKSPVKKSRAKSKKSSVKRRTTKSRSRKN